MRQKSNCLFSYSDISLKSRLCFQKSKKDEKDTSILYFFPSAVCLDGDMGGATCLQTYLIHTRHLRMTYPQANGTNVECCRAGEEEEEEGKKEEEEEGSEKRGDRRLESERTVRKGRETRTKEDVVGERLRKEPSRSDMWESLILLYAPQDLCVTTFDHLNGYTHSTIAVLPSSVLRRELDSTTVFLNN